MNKKTLAALAFVAVLGGGMNLPIPAQAQVVYVTPEQQNELYRLPQTAADAVGAVGYPQYWERLDHLVRSVAFTGVAGSQSVNQTFNGILTNQPYLEPQVSRVAYDLNYRLRRAEFGYQAPPELLLNLGDFEILAERHRHEHERWEHETHERDEFKDRMIREGHQQPVQTQPATPQAIQQHQAPPAIQQHQAPQAVQQATPQPQAATAHPTAQASPTGNGQHQCDPRKDPNCPHQCDPHKDPNCPH
jgi:hypothetical protein